MVASRSLLLQKRVGVRGFMHVKTNMGTFISLVTVSMERG
jgi:hypothetical protein